MGNKVIKWVAEESDDLMGKIDNPIRTFNCSEAK